MKQDRWDVVIIGGGLAGLVAANVLALYDLKVLLLEKSTQVGGRAQTQLKNGVYFNMGPHALYRKGQAVKILGDLQVNLPGGVPKTKGIITWQGHKYATPFTPLSLLSSSLLTWKEKKAFIKVLYKIQKVNIDTIQDLPWQEWLDQQIHHERVKQLILLLSRLSAYCHFPELASAKVMLYHVRTAISGALYVNKGWQTIIGQLHQRALDAGVEIQTGAAVQSVEGVSPKFSVHLSDQQTLITKYVISTVGPQENKQLWLGSERSLEFLEKIVPVKGAALDIALHRLPNPRRHFAMDLHQPLYYSNHSAVARLTDHPSHSVIHVFRYLKPDENIDASALQYELEHYLESIQPGWQDVLVRKRFLPNIVVNQRLPKAGDDVESNPLHGYFVAGDWTSPQAILAESAIPSGARVAQSIISQEGIISS